MEDDLVEGAPRKGIREERLQKVGRPEYHGSARTGVYTTGLPERDLLWEAAS